jgi:O-methyltransferase
LKVRKGWFEDTLGPAREEIGSIALLHCDSDWYESVRVTLENLYPLVSSGGVIVIDDYGGCPGAGQATRDFKAGVGDDAPLVSVDQTGCYWFKPGSQARTS